MNDGTVPRWCIYHQRSVGRWGHIVAAACPNDPACDVVTPDDVRRLRATLRTVADAVVWRDDVVWSVPDDSFEVLDRLLPYRGDRVAQP